MNSALKYNLRHLPAHIGLIVIVSAVVAKGVVLWSDQSQQSNALTRQQSVEQVVQPSMAQKGGVDLVAPDAKTMANFSDIQSIVLRDTSGQLKAVAQHSAPFGLTGVVMAPVKGSPSDRLIGYIIPQSQALMIGMLYGNDGSNVTAAIAQSLPAPTQQSDPVSRGDVGSTAQGMELPQNKMAVPFVLSDFSYRNEGDGPVKLAVFFDPNCIFCNQLWHEIHAIPNYQHQFTISWVPLGMLKPTSAGKSAAILKAQGVNGLDKDEAWFDPATETGGIYPSSDKKLVAQIDQNDDKWTSLMTKSGLPLATPAIVVNGQSIIVGAPNAYQLSKIGQAVPNK